MSYNTAAHKRAINLTLNEDLITQVRKVTGNLSSVVESLLADFLESERERRMADAALIAATVATWNRFAEQHGGFADEHSTL